jgi:quinol monooxygenase YgiN
VTERLTPGEAVLELRQYTLKPGRRDELIDLFDTHFVGGQADAGIDVLGQFRDLDDPDRFVWLRSFDSYDTRAAALPGFYYGPVWRAHRAAANDTMLDSDDVLMLRSVQMPPGYPADEPRPGRPPDGSSVVAITVACLDGPVEPVFVRFVLDRVAPQLRAAGGPPLAVLVSDPGENNFPVLPVREENATVWISRFSDDAAYHRHLAALDASAQWRQAVLPELLAHARLQRLRLRPTAKSRLR